MKASRRPGKSAETPEPKGILITELDRKAERKVVIAAVITALVLIGDDFSCRHKFMGGGLPALFPE